MSESTDEGQRVGLSCPACSPEAETVHEVLHPHGTPTVRCTECGHVHRSTLPERRTVQRRVVVSQGGESVSATAEPPAEEALAVGEEFLVETDEAILTVRITSLECEDGRRERAPAEAVETIWTRAVGNVSVPVTAHPNSGSREGTRSLELQVPGDHEFVVGEREQLAGEQLTVEGIYVRDDARGYEHDKLDFDGDSVLAKDIKRLYVRDESTSGWSAW
jgi:uncharacterized Zn finger protein